VVGIAVVAGGGAAIASTQGSPAKAPAPAKVHVVRSAPAGAAVVTPHRCHHGSASAPAADL
jgi:hypothetical protein